MNNFTLEIDAEGIALLTFDVRGRAMNMIDQSVMDDLDSFVTRLSEDAAIRGAVITSAKSAFSPGADLAVLARLGDDKIALGEKAGRLSAICRRLETCGKPVAAAINGLCLGGGCELALACHYRVMADAKGAVIGLPESKVGLLPGAGGTQRLPRLIGAEPALRLMLRGTAVEPREAEKLGIVHRIAGLTEIVGIAKQWIRDGGSPIQPWDTKGFMPPGGDPNSPRSVTTWVAANALYRKETYDNFDAQRAIMSCVYQGLLVKSIDAGLAIERDYFARLLLGSQSKAMIRSLFFSPRELEKGARRPAAEPSRVKRLGVVGAGFMGAGVAYVSALAGIEIVLLDRDIAAAERGKAHSAGLLDKDVQKGARDNSSKGEVLSRITPTASFDDLASCDLVIEAVFENRGIKSEVWSKIDAALPPSAVRASNTSTLPITGLADHVGDPSSFVGIHFFSPVDKMRLVEIIRGKKTSDTTLARAFDYVRQIGKTPIIVNDSRSFFTSRVVTTHIAEGHAMLEEGIPPALIENAGRMAGMPVGPLALADEIALDLAWKIQQATKADLGEAFEERAIDRLLEKMVVMLERFGRKNARGYYDYPPGERKRLWPGIAEIVTPRPASDFDVEELKERLLLIQALETVRCLEENVLTDVREADVGAILGFGFAPFTGGPLTWLDTMGAPAAVAKCERYATKFGPRYAPPQLLLDLAQRGETFYGRYAGGHLDGA